MKRILFALFVCSFFLSVHAEEPAVGAPVSDAPVAVNEQKSDPATPDVQNAVPPASVPAATEAAQPLKEDVKTPESKVSPVAVSPAMATESAKDEGAVSPVASTVPVAGAPEALKIPESKVVEPTLPAGCVASLQQIVVYHEKEMADLKERIARWDVKVGPMIKRQQDLSNELKTKLKKQEDLLNQNTKASKKEASALKKEMTKIGKDLQAVDKELKIAGKDLSAEIKTLSQESSQSLKAACQQAIADIQKSEK